MDPNETLQQLRGMIANFFNTLDEGRQIDDALTLAEDMADRFIALDGWITKGGFYPDAWQGDRIGEPDKPLGVSNG